MTFGRCYEASYYNIIFPFSFLSDKYMQGSCLSLTAISQVCTYSFKFNNFLQSEGCV